jgi:predicted Zn-dependent peptidase
MDLKDPGLFMFMAVANEGVDALKIEKEILDTIAQIKQGQFEEKDINKIKINTKADFIFSLESSSEVASLYGSYLVRGNINPLLNYEKNVEKLTKKDLIDVANKYLIEKNSTTVILKEEK